MNPTELALFLMSDILNNLVLKNQPSKIYTHQNFCEFLKLEPNDPLAIHAVTLCRKAAAGWSTVIIDPESYVPKIIFYKPDLTKVTKSLSSLLNGEFL